MNQFGGKRLVAALIVVLVGAAAIAAVGMNSGVGGAKVDRNVPGATTGAGKASLTD